MCLGVFPLGAQQAPPACTNPDAPVRIDHVVVAVGDLDRAARTYDALGFSQKPGRLHSNGLLNRLMKLADGTELEVMAVQEPPGDPMAEAYEAFITEGEGGAYLALEGPRSVVLETAADRGVAANALDEPPFRYVTFRGPGLEGIFFVEYGGRPPVDPDLLLHENRAEGIAEVWLEAGPGLGLLLEGLGARRCGESVLDDGTRGTGYGLARGVVVIVPHGSTDRPRVLGIALRLQDPGAGWFVPAAEAHGIWLRAGDGPP